MTDLGKRDKTGIIKTIKQDSNMTKKSLLIKDTTVDERMAIVKESLNFCDGDCDGVDMDDMYDDYIFGRRELADINLEFSRKHAGEVVPNRPSAPRGCMGR